MHKKEGKRKVGIEQVTIDDEDSDVFWFHVSVGKEVVEGTEPDLFSFFLSGGHEGMRGIVWALQKIRSFISGVV